MPCVIWLLSLLLPMFDLFASQPRLSVENERIMAMRTNDGLLLSDQILIYDVLGEWMLPLGETAQLTGLSISVYPKLGRAEGHLLNKKEDFLLTTKDCRAAVKGSKLKKFRCSSVTVYGNEIFVKQKLLEKLFPFKIKVDSFRSEIVLHPQTKLPPQLKADRERGAKRISAMGSQYDPGFPRFSPSRSFLEGPFIDTQIFAWGMFSDGEFSPILQHSTLASGEILGLEAQGYLSGDEREISSSRLNLAVKSNEGDLLGPLAATELQFLDVLLPSLPLIADGQTGRGAIVSNFDLHSPDSYGTHSFEGILPRGWDVELYHNEVLVGYRSGNSEGRYVFSDVPLLIGTNIFKLSFYGPQGQRRDEYQTFRIDSSFMRPGQLQYKTAYGLISGTKERYTLQVEKFLFPYVTGRIGYGYLDFDGLNSRHYALLGFNAFQNNMLLSGNAVVTEEKTYAFELSLGIPLRWVALQMQYTQGSQFESLKIKRRSDQFFKRKIGFSATHPFPSLPAVGVRWEVDAEEYEGQQTDLEASNNLAFRLWRLMWDHRLSYRPNNAIHFDGRLRVRFNLPQARFRFGIYYQLGGDDLVRAFDGEMIYRLSKDYSLSTKVAQELNDQSTVYTFSIFRDFNLLTLSGNFFATSRSQYGIGALLTMSFGRKPKSFNWKVQSKPMAMFGALMVKVFQDNDYNGKFNEGDVPIPHAEILVNQDTDDNKTDEKGIAYISSLPTHQPIDVSVSLMSLENPMLKPKPKGIRMFLRPGKTAKVFLPVVEVGEIDGNIKTFGSTNVISRGILLILVNEKGKEIQRTRSDMDGYYLFENILPGKYFVKLSEEQLKQLSLNSDRISRPVTLSQDQPFKSDIDFYIRKTK